MYETEVNSKSESSDQIPADVLAQFSELNGRLLKRTVLPWSEHCTECVWPTCYSSCDLYSRREDGRCRRFSDGMVRINCPGVPNSYLLKIRFKRWGKLWTPGTLMLRTLPGACRLEARDYRIGTMLQGLPGFIPGKNLAIHKRYGFKKRIAYRSTVTSSLPSCFLLECYNPASRTVRLSLTMRSVDGQAKIPFQKLVQLGPGFHRVRVPYDEIAGFVDLRSPFNIDLVPNEDQVETTLYFGMMEFVLETPAPEPVTGHGETKVKCVVWDLDNTVWDGILVEDGSESLQLKPQIEQILRILDERGILSSIVSKNEREEALSVLKAFGIAEYFLSPQISWQPKSHGIGAITHELNIGVDSVLFVDDSEFELQEVKAVHPKVRVLNAEHYLTIPNIESCQVDVTAESRTRRKMYEVEVERKTAACAFGKDYLAFLRYCDLKLGVSPMTRENLNRVHELTQRTNQMNFSGNRYEKSVLEEILGQPYLDTYVLEVEDRFGSYGIVGFCIVDNRVPLMTDLMFSCRVQAKRVEHAFLAYLIQQYIAITGKDFHANYRKTSRNAPSGHVFSDLLLQEMGVENGVSHLVFPKDREVPADGVIAITVHEPVEAAKP
jgi:FkbH-like protein